ncbi:MAG: glycosyltransferase family 2 protein [Deltaproteobacteria bacterium]|nr:glycosyltransferase family 2 protein [Deltaproteobacteria bacterium]
MRISGFSFVRNAIELYYPVVESIRSILPICDEFVIAAGDSTDGTTELLRSIDDPKVKIIETVWDRNLFKRGAINAQQTNIALDACTGDWCFYVQADEVVHERYLPALHARMETYLADDRIEGLLFDYVHFFADYEHYHTSHTWYRREVRIVRNRIGARSWKSAQGFRFADGRKLHVAHAYAAIYHYGWVRPPRNMTRKRIAFVTIHEGAETAQQKFPDANASFDFGLLKGRTRFSGTHPAVMQARIEEKNWTVHASPESTQRHDRLSERALSFVEQRILGFKVGEHRNYILLPS